MTAQIIDIAAYRQPSSLAHAVTQRAKRGRGLRLTNAAAAVLARINRGEVITDIGQIDKPTRRVLKRLLDKGYVYRGVDNAFPKEKTCWAGVDYWTVNTNDGEFDCSMPTCVKFREL